MPAQLEGSVKGQIAVRPSAVFELMWVFHTCAAIQPPTRQLDTYNPIRLKFGDQLSAFWQDGVEGCTELIVLGHRSGTLFDLDLDGFFGRLEGTAAAGGPVPSLLSEPGEEQQPLRERLERLRADAGMRRRYLELLRAVWHEIKPEWVQAGRAAVVAEIPRWRRRLEEGEDYHDILGRTRLWKGRPELDAMADAAAADGKVVLSPGWFFGDIHVVEVDGTVYLGRGVRPRFDEADFRTVATEVSTSVKALADPTRLSILLWLAQQPASITEIARHFNLSQPTISSHVQLLREAHLVDETPSGRSAMLSASEEGLRRLFANAQESLVKMFHS